jgi:hypothetical protein
MSFPRFTEGGIEYAVNPAWVTYIHTDTTVDNSPTVIHVTSGGVGRIISTLEPFEKVLAKLSYAAS